MDDEQHYESFNMDNDFDGLVEVGGEFMFRSVHCSSITQRMQLHDIYQSRSG
jgi:hypothetical protein